MTTIPKIIHQLWVGELEMPLRWMNTWKEMHPDWEYILWDDKRIRDFKFKNQKHIDFYMGRKVWHGVADVVRYEVLYKYGGFWAGADSECINRVDELFTDDYFDTYTFYENEKVRPELVAPLCACKPNSEFVKMLIDGLYAKKEVGVPWKTTGNLYVKEMIARTNYKRIKIFPSYYFVPEHYTGVKYTGKGRIYARHYFGTTKKRYGEGR